MSFHAGQRVVCVDARDDGDALDAFGGLLRRGRVYTVRSIPTVWSEKFRREMAGVRIAEIILPINQRFGLEHFFSSGRFRSLDEARPNQFRAHLAPAPKHKARERA